MGNLLDWAKLVKIFGANLLFFILLNQDLWGLHVFLKIFFSLLLYALAIIFLRIFHLSGIESLVKNKFHSLS